MSDLKKINDKKLKSKIKEFISEVENCESIEQLTNIKKLKGDPTAYRWRTGDYRLGFYKSGSAVELACFVKRNDIYKVFP